MSSNGDVVKTECGDCFIGVQVDLANMVAAAKIPSNGKRGKGHVAAHWLSTDMTSDGTLALWECPACGYADSTYIDPATRKALS